LTRVYGLPPLESDTKGESLRSYSRADWTIAAGHHFAATALLAPRRTTYAGLSTVNPQSVSASIDTQPVRLGLRVGHKSVTTRSREA
jgi:hypothetical protein